jgi:hypothetical protein
LGLQAGVNLYLYSRAGPVTYVDPDGMWDVAAAFGFGEKKAPAPSALKRAGEVAATSLGGAPGYAFKAWAPDSAKEVLGAWAAHRQEESAGLVETAKTIGWLPRLPSEVQKDPWVGVKGFRDLGVGLLAQNPISLIASFVGNTSAAAAAPTAGEKAYLGIAALQDAGNLVAHAFGFAETVRGTGAAPHESGSSSGNPTIEVRDATPQERLEVFEAVAAERVAEVKDLVGTSDEFLNMAKGGSGPKAIGAKAIQMAKVAAGLRGAEILGEEVTVVTAEESRRIIDLLTLEPVAEGPPELTNVEVKANTSKYTMKQQLDDASLASKGGVGAGPRAEGAGIAGKHVRLRTLLERYKVEK